MKQLARILVLAATSLLLVPSAFAAEFEPATDGPATASAPTRNLFSSWFSARSAKPEVVAIEADEAESPPPAAAPYGMARAGDLVVGALGLLGISYRLGGNTPASGFDCSGMVRYVFQTAMGLDLPRRAEEISRIGTRVDRNDLKPGDLVFYKTLRKTFSHVGIYLGNNRFIHAPSAGGAVRVDDMSQSYWTARFNGARRVGP